MTEPRWGYRPSNRDPIALKLWEIRHQLDINIDIIKLAHPEPEPRILPHIAEMVTDHVYERLAELEALLKSKRFTATLISHDNHDRPSIMAQALGSSAFDASENLKSLVEQADTTIDWDEILNDQHPELTLIIR